MADGVRVVKVLARLEVRLGQKGVDVSRRNFLNLRPSAGIHDPDVGPTGRHPRIDRALIAIRDGGGNPLLEKLCPERPSVLIRDSVADRTPRPRKRGAIVGCKTDPFRRRAVHYDSGIELKVLTCLIASPRIVEIREQRRVAFDHGGRRHQYFVDFFVVWSDGTRSVIEVKYTRDVARSGVVERLNLMRDRVGDAVADDWRLVTEDDIDLVTLANAEKIISCGLDFDLEGQAIVRRFLKEAGSGLKFADIRRVLGVRGYRAAVALVQAGDICVPPGRRIELDCPIEAGDQAAAA